MTLFQGEARLVEWNSVYMSLAKRACRLWRHWDLGHGWLQVMQSKSEYVGGSGAGDPDLIQRWQEMVAGTSGTWQEILGLPIYWADEDDEEEGEEGHHDLDMGDEDGIYREYLE